MTQAIHRHPRTAAIAALASMLTLLAAAGHGCRGRGDQGLPATTGPTARRVATLASQEPDASGEPNATQPAAGQAQTASRPAVQPATAPATAAATASSVGLGQPAGRQLVILHTNDNWGEAVPCG